jgi:hypothetical protein
MATAAAALRYEVAAATRDRLQLLSWLDDRLTFLRSARRGGSVVYPLAGPDGSVVWYLIQRGEVQAAIREPRDATAQADAAALLATTTAGPDVERAVTDRMVDSVLLVAAWFRKFPNEKARLLNYTDALAAPTA